MKTATTHFHLSPCGRGRIASSDAIGVRGGGTGTTRVDPPPQPSPRGERERTAILLLRDEIVVRSHHERDVCHAGHLELADFQRRADGAGIGRARRVPVLARAGGICWSGWCRLRST